MSLLIKPLEYLPEHSGQVAIWHHQECERQGLRSSLALRRQRLELHLQQRTLPKTLVAQLAGEPAGCVSLVRYALGQSDAASPLWLANLFVWGSGLISILVFMGGLERKPCGTRVSGVLD